MFVPDRPGAQGSNGNGPAGIVRPAKADGRRPQ